MKIKLFSLTALTVALAFSPLAGFAQTPAVPDASTQTALQALFKDVQSKYAADKRAESDYANEIKSLDNLIAKAKTSTNLDEAAQITFMKAQLYLEIFNEPDKGVALIKQIKTDYPQTKLGERADELAVSAQVAAKANTDKSLTEADFAPELKAYDDLLAKQNGAKTDEAAGLLYKKAMIYINNLDEPDKGIAIIEQIKTDYPDTRIGQNADKVIASVKEGAAAKKIQDALVKGSTFPDFSAQGLDGKPLSVASYKGKVVLVDFWATWCGPCRAELPNVIATYKKHHAAGFEIIGVSLDDERDKLTDFLKKTDGMTWPEFFDGKGWQNKLAEKYGVRSIPFNVLVDGNGKIIGTGLRGEDLEKAVATAVAHGKQS